jgi:hypothetical protein
MKVRADPAEGQRGITELLQLSQSIRQSLNPVVVFDLGNPIWSPCLHTMLRPCESPRDTGNRVRVAAGKSRSPDHRCRIVRVHQKA